MPSSNVLFDLAAPQGFEPRYADPESAVLPLNEGAATCYKLALHEPLSILWAASIPVNGVDSSAMLRNITAYFTARAG